MGRGGNGNLNFEPAFAKAMAGMASNQPSLKLRRAQLPTSNIERHVTVFKFA